MLNKYRICLSLIFVLLLSCSIPLDDDLESDKKSVYFFIDLNADGWDDKEYEVLTELIEINNISITGPEDLNLTRDENGRITTLRLSSLNISQLPDGIDMLSKLEFLFLNNNPIEELPEKIVNLAYLETLNVMNCNLSQIPEDMDKMNNLRYVRFRYNNIQSFPLTIVNVKNLKSLDLGYNLMIDIPDSLSNFQNLEEISLTSNLLTTLPKSLTEIKSLKYVYVYDNQLYCENGHQNLDLIPNYLTNGSGPIIAGLYDQSCSK